MSSHSLTLQCHQCSGVFAVPKVDFSSVVKCPHCAIAAPVMDFAELNDSPSDDPESSQSILQNPQTPLGIGSDPAATTSQTQNEGTFNVRGKWLQFDCPHCVRPMRLIAEDAGGLVDCAHCGLELIAPDPAIGRGAQLSRASEGRVGSITRFNLRDLRGDQLKHSKAAQDPESFAAFEEAEEEEFDPNHAIARGSAESLPSRKRAVKALEPGQLERSFRRQEVLAQRAIANSPTEWDPLEASRPSFGKSRQDRYGFWIALGIAGAVMVGIVALVVREASKSDKVFDDSQLSAIQVAQKQKRARFIVAFEAAKQALASPTWEALVTHVRAPNRVAPLMRAYYANEPYEPIGLTGFHAPIEVTVGNLIMYEMKVTETGGNTRTLVVGQGGSKVEIDWELLVNLPRYKWNQFLETRPSDPQAICVIASRSSVLDRYFEDAGQTRETALGFHLWQSTADSYFAILPKSSELAKKLSGLLEWDKGRKIVIEASFDSSSQLDDRIQIGGLVQTGWVIR